MQLDGRAPRRGQRDAQVAAIGVRDVDADLEAGDRQRLGDVDRVADAGRVVVGNRAIRRRRSARASSAAWPRPTAGSGRSSTRRRPRSGRWSGSTRCRSTICCRAWCRRRSARAAPAYRSPAIAHLAPLALELEQPVGLLQRQLVVAGAGHLLVAVVAVLVHVPDRQPLVGQRGVAPGLWRFSMRKYSRPPRE